MILNKQDIINQQDGQDLYYDFAVKANELGYTIIAYDTYYEALPPVITFEELKANKLAEINNSYAQEANLVKVGTPDDEVSTWDIQRLEAQAWQKDNDIETPFLTILALQRGVDRVWLIEKVLEKVNAFERYMADLTGKRQKLEDAIKSATTIEEVEDISWTS